MNEAHIRDSLRLVAERLARRGYYFRDAPFFAQQGVAVFVEPTAVDGISVVEQNVFLYPIEGGWEARVTQHGGYHWTRAAPDLDSLEQVALEALQREPGIWTPPNWTLR